MFDYSKKAKELLPQILVRSITGIFYGWHGNYQDWDSALEKCSGYDSESILSKVKEAALKVKKGEAEYERDSVLFNDKVLNTPLLTALLFIATQKDGNLNILDFGGSLGSSYYQSRPLLKHLMDLKWNIVEQQKYVDCGLGFFQDRTLRFYNSIGDCLKENSPDIVILLSVLPYLKYPYEVLDSIMQLDFNYLFFDKMPFISGPDRITVQKVNPSIYNASYPCWFFNRKKFEDKISASHELIFRFKCDDRSNIRSEFEGLFYKKIR